MTTQAPYPTSRSASLRETSDRLRRLERVLAALDARRRQAERDGGGVPPAMGAAIEEFRRDLAAARRQQARITAGSGPDTP